MGSKKGQLFIVGIIFLLGLIFFIQQALFQYSETDISEPFDSVEIDLMENIMSNVNQTIHETHSCDETKDSFSARIEELRTSMLLEYGRMYTTEMIYTLDCSKWSNSPPQTPPLTMTISISGLGKDTRGTFNFYHSE